MAAAEHAREPIRFLVFSASLQEESLNTRLARLAAAVIEAQGGDVELGRMQDFDSPSYDSDVERADGLPPGAQALRERVLANDAFVVVSPEYNASMPGVLKNAIDWVSRSKPQPFHERHGLLLSASPSMVGGNRGLWALRVPFEHLGARIYPEMFSLAQAHAAFDDDGRIANAPAPGALRGDHRRIHGPRRGREALSVRETQVGRVPRRAPGAGSRSRRVAAAGIRSGAGPFYRA